MLDYQERLHGGSNLKSSSENIVEVTSLKFAYGARQVLKGLSLTIPRGKVVAILGASGCGKSTLLRLIGGQERPARGHVKVDGRVVHKLDTDGLYELRRKMGMMFQTSGLFSDLTVFENIAFPMREHTSLSEDLIRRLVLMKLQAVGLRGAHPLMGLDPISLNVIADLIRRLNDTLGTTSIVVTYDVDEALNVADYVYIIGDGVVAGEGAPAEMENSEDPFVRQFIHAQPDGPIAFHYPSRRPLGADLGL